MPTNPPPKPRVSSPAATGAAGTYFEQHVDAYWLALLLTRAFPPVLCDCTVVEVHLQTEHLGWNTDDLLVVGESGAGARRNLVCQVKRSFVVSAADGECQKTILDFWRDFAGERFAPERDRFLLVTLRGTNALLEHFVGLLDCARSARDGEDFDKRLATPGFVNAKALHYRDEVLGIISQVEGRTLTTAEIWPLLRVLHVLSLDLGTSTRQTEAAIKTLLAYSTTGPDREGTADTSWATLLKEVVEGMPGARSYLREDLPEELRRRHSPVVSAGHQAVQALADHSKPILRGIRPTIGNSLHLERGIVVQQVMDAMTSAQVVLVTGVAGSGKSGVAKTVVDAMGGNHFAFCFRAEEFALPHLDETLLNSQIPVNGVQLGAILAGQGRKMLLVESVERLLEASTRDAFTDLLDLVRRDPSWQVVLTCRDYSADLVRACFLESAGIGCSVIAVPALTDAELQETAVTYPVLARPLSSGHLRELLRNPYFLDKALQLPWSEDRSLPENEREFRARFWQEIIRADHQAGSGMPRRREEAFAQIALRRARSLTLYAPASDLDQEAIDSLRKDGLIIISGRSNALVAPAHDVLEDWAILRWIDDEYEVHEGSAAKLAEAIGTFPAVRRTYRKWIGELVDRDPDGADAVFEAVIVESTLPTHYRDDTLAAMLGAPSSAVLLARHRTALFANDKDLLRRVIHLLRVACVRTPEWLGSSGAQASLLSVPVGEGWAAVLHLVQAGLATFSKADRPLLLGLIEDWARGVAWWSPYPDGTEPVAAIAHWLLPQYEGYREDEQQKRVVQVIAKIPKGDPARFIALLRPDPNEARRGGASDTLREIVLEGIEGMPACRDFPKDVVSATEEYLLCSESDLDDGRGYRGSLELDTLFGFSERTHHDFFPASAWRGPFLFLLQHHPREGLDLLVALCNHSAEWYGHPRVHMEFVEPPFEITLTLPDGVSQRQWCNARLWNLYRGTSVGPYVLQSALMALEQWLLDVAEKSSHELDGLLLGLLRRSDSVALTAVVASVATAFPQGSGETLLVLLGSRECMQLDRHRLASESQVLAGVLPQLDAANRVFDEERVRADKRPHRRRDLETAIATLQLGPLAKRVQDLLDRHRLALPKGDARDDETKVWMLALHRMDLRQYAVDETATEVLLNGATGTESSDGKKWVPLSLKIPEPELIEMVEETTSRHEAMTARIGLLMWGQKMFAGEGGTDYDPAHWHQRLQEAMSAPRAPVESVEMDLGSAGPGFVAAVCARDRWEEMSSSERQWCVDVICSEVERHSDNWNDLWRVQRGGMSADRPCAWVLPSLLGRSLPRPSHNQVLRLIPIAVTHPTTEVRMYAAAGVGTYVWASDPDLVLRCVDALAQEAKLVQHAWDREKRRPYDQRREYDVIEAEATMAVRRRFAKAKTIGSNAYESFDASTWTGAEANVLMLRILAGNPGEEPAIGAFRRLATILVQWWNDDEVRSNRRRERNYKTESVLTQLLEDVLLRTTTDAATLILGPILESVDRHPREAARVLSGIISAEDRRPSGDQFWTLWSLFADKVRGAKWLSGIDEESADGREMIEAVFLGLPWKENVRHWRCLDGHAAHIHALFEDLPASASALDRYVGFLYHIGEQSLPEAFVRITERVRDGGVRRMLRKGNTVFMLEALLRRWVYGRPLELKRQPHLRSAVLELLDMLIESGSSAAFRMRDDFVTPASGV